jgi:hypothetical protein
MSRAPADKIAARTGKTRMAVWLLIRVKKDARLNLLE